MLCAFWAGCSSPANGPDLDLSIIKVESFSIEPRGRTVFDRFVFVSEGLGYSLAKADGTVIADSIPYRKTFGGRMGRIEIHLIADRFLAYPVTVDDTPIVGSDWYDMLAVVRVYDLKFDAVIYESCRFQYNHDIPLSYDVFDVLRSAEE